jgi:hypothetical protein
MITYVASPAPTTSTAVHHSHKPSSNHCSANTQWPWEWGEVREFSGPPSSRWITISELNGGQYREHAGRA